MTATTPTVGNHCRHWSANIRTTKCSTDSGFQIRHECQELLAGGATDRPDRPAVVHDDDLVGQSRSVEVMSDHDNHLACVCHVPQSLQYDAGALGVQRPRRLVGEDDALSPCDCAAQRRALLLAAGQRASRCLATMAEPEGLDELGDQTMRRRSVVEPERQLDVLPRCGSSARRSVKEGGRRWGVPRWRAN